jgi:hypothetical protein
MNKQKIISIGINLLLFPILLISCSPGKLFGPTLTPTPRVYTLTYKDTSWDISIKKSNTVKIDDKEISSKEGNIFITIYFNCPCKNIPKINEDQTYLEDINGNKYYLLDSPALVDAFTYEIISLRLIFSEIPSDITEVKLVIGQIEPINLQIL